MWRRTYILLLLVRVFFALCPSYIHPDENFQGPEVLAGKFALAVFLLQDPNQLVVVVVVACLASSNVMSWCRILLLQLSN